MKKIARENVMKATIVSVFEMGAVLRLAVAVIMLSVGAILLSWTLKLWE